MSISVACPSCAAKLNAPDGAAGKRVKCPKCQTAMLVPEPALAADFEVVDDPQPRKQPVPRPKVKAVVQADVEPDDEDEKPRKKRRADEDEEEDRPKKKKKKRSGDEEEGGVSTTRNIVMGVVLIILLAVAAYVFYDKFKEKKDTSIRTQNGSLMLPVGV